MSFVARRYKVVAMRRILIVMVLVIVTVLLVPVNSYAKTLDEPTYPAVNSPIGVYFRNSPQATDTDHVPGHGVYEGNNVQLKCYAFGDTMEDPNDSLWYYAVNVTHPSVPNTGASNEGFLNNFYVNDALAANQVEPSVPPCKASSSPTIQEGASVYYSPFQSDSILGHQGFSHLYVKSVSSKASKTLYKQDWTGTECDPNNVGNFDDMIDGKLVTVLSGWSLGRMGPIYFLKAFPERAKQIHYIVLFDPGALGELKDDCYHDSISETLRAWLDNDPKNRLVIMAGKATRDWDSRVEGSDGRTYAHQGIQQVYFSQLHDPQYSSKVAVCNYDNMWHEDVWTNFQDIVNQPPIEDTCPVDSGTGTSPNSWHP